MKDIIIILGGGIEADGSIPGPAKLRVEKGVELLKEGRAPRILMSAKWSFWLTMEPPRTEAEGMKEYAVELGVNPEQILKEESSKDTVSNAYFTRIEFLEPNNWKNVILVTSDYHMPRSKYIFEKVLGPDYQIECVASPSGLSEQDFKSHVEREAKTMVTLKKFADPIPAGDLEAIKNFLYTKHPGYAKDPEVSKEQLLRMLGR